MIELMKDNPWLTFFVFLAVLSCIEVVAKAVLKTRCPDCKRRLELEFRRAHPFAEIDDD